MAHEQAAVDGLEESLQEHVLANLGNHNEKKKANLIAMLKKSHEEVILKEKRDKMETTAFLYHFKDIIMEHPDKFYGHQFGTKVVVVGNQGTGKTTLIQALLDKSKKKDHDETTAWSSASTTSDIYNTSHTSLHPRTIAENTKKATRESPLSPQYSNLWNNQVLVRTEVTPKSVLGTHLSTQNSNMSKPTPSKVVLLNGDSNGIDALWVNKSRRHSPQIESAMRYSIRESRKMTEEQKLELTPSYNTASLLIIDKINGTNVVIPNDQDVELLQDTLGMHMSVWDFTCRAPLYPLLDLLMSTEYGVYVITCDVRTFLDPSSREDAVESLQIWIKSVTFLSPKCRFLIVVTFYEKVNHEDNQDIFRKVDSIISKTKVSLATEFRHHIPNSENGLLHFPYRHGHDPMHKRRKYNRDASASVNVVLQLSDTFRMLESSTAGKENVYISDLKFIGKAIEETQVAENMMMVSYRWMCFVGFIEKYSRSHYMLSLKEAKIEAKRFGINSAEELNQILHLLHEYGKIFYFTNRDSLRENIITQPEWLFSSLARVFLLESSGLFDEEIVTGLEEDAEILIKDGLATHDLLEFVLGKANTFYLFDVLLENMMISHWRFGCEYTSYLIPAFLPTQVDHEIAAFKEGSLTKNWVRCVFDFSKGYLPSGIFQRLICLCVSYCNDWADISELNEPKLSKGFCCIEIEPGLTLQLVQDVETQAITTMVEACQAAKSLNVLGPIITKIKTGVLGRPGLGFDTLLEDNNSGKLIRIEEARKQSLSPWFKEAVLVSSEKPNFNSFLEAF